MTARASALAQLLAAWDGDTVTPAALAAVVAQPDTPGADTTIEQLKAAALADFGDVPRVLAAMPSLTLGEVSQLAKRLGWTVKALAEWDPREDRPGPRIEAALMSAAVWDEAGSFWEAARSWLEGAHTTLAGLEIVVRGRGVRTQVLENAPIWEREHLQALQEAERIGDWAHLGERASAFQRLPNPDLCARQAITALALLDWPRLVRLADSMDSWLSGHQLLSSLPLETAFRLATASRSDHIRFAALERVVRREVRSLSASEEAALRNLLIVLAQDAHGWPAWLAVFNRYPTRHPHIQAALGQALARSAERAFHAYVESIVLTTSDSGGRTCVTRCLSTFRAKAGAVRRRALWREAFARWQAWGFATSEKRPLTEVARSALDYGVVGWLIEGEPQRQPLDPEQVFSEGLRALEMEWHSTVSWAISGFVCLLSRHQILAHASARSVGDVDWLPGPDVAIPVAADDPFVRRRYPWREENERGPEPLGRIG